MEMWVQDVYVKIVAGRFFKLGMLALGIAIGTYWRDVFGADLLVFIIVAVVSLAYVTYVWGKQ